MEHRLLHDPRPDGSVAIDTWGEALRHVIVHEIHHVGHLSVWAREVGKKPASANLIGRGLMPPPQDRMDAEKEPVINIRKLHSGESPPMELLLLADPSRPLVEEYLQRGHCFVGDRDGTIVGVYVLLQTRPATVELVNIAVAECHQGKGIGKRLVRHAVQTARSLGFQTIEVGTGNSGVGQLALYQKCGFRMTGIDLDFFTRHYKEEIVENGIQIRDMVRLSQEL